MKLYTKALELLGEGRQPAMGTVIDSQGSTPQKPGSQALILEDGSLWGTLGGGLVEARGLTLMKESLEQGVPGLLEVSLKEEYSRGAGPICGGIMRIFAAPLSGSTATAYQTALESRTRNERGVLVTQISSGTAQGETRWIAESHINGGNDFPDPAQLAQTLHDEQPYLFQSEAGEEVYVDPVVVEPRLLIIGGGHVGQAVAVQADILGFDVTVYDDREEFADPGWFPAGTTTAYGDLKTLVQDYRKDDDTYIVLVSKGHKPDAEALEGCIHSIARYIGMIGSKRKIRFLKKHFIEDGIATEKEWSRLHSPIGYDIGAVTVPEIGVSIAAQLVAARRNIESLDRLHSKSLQAK